MFKGGLRRILPTESPLKMMKNAFYFTLKALFVREIFEFFLDVAFMLENGWIRETRLISKCMTSQPG